MTAGTLNKRTLAIAPNTRGFEFALMETTGKLADWGAVGIAREKNANTVKKTRELIQLYRPDILVIEDYAANSYPRSQRIRLLGRELGELGAWCGTEFRALPMAEVGRRLSGEASRRTFSR